MSIKRRITFIIFFNLFIFAKLGNYISVQIKEFDDCIMNIKINNEKFVVTPDYIIYNFNLYNCYRGLYFGGSWNSGDFIIRNHELNFKEKVEFVFGDSDHTEGWMNINVYFNEYLIQTKDRVFWICRDCEDTYNKDYYIENEERDYENTNEIRGKYGGHLSDPKNKIFFYKIPGNGTRDKVYTYHFDFIINDITELYNGGNDQNHSPFQVTHNYYSLGPENKTFEFTIYAPQNELELINFNITEHFHVTDNNALLGNYANYYFEVEGFNNVVGNLK